MKLIEYIVHELEENFIITNEVVEQMLFINLGTNRVFKYDHICANVNTHVGSKNIPIHEDLIKLVEDYCNALQNSSKACDDNFNKIKEEYSHLGELKAFGKNSGYWGFCASDFIKFVKPDVNKIKQYFSNTKYMDMDIDNPKEWIELTFLNRVDLIKLFNFEKDFEKDFNNFLKSCKDLVDYYENCDNLINEIKHNYISNEVIISKFTEDYNTNNTHTIYHQNICNSGSFDRVYNICLSTNMIFVESKTNTNLQNAFFFERFIRWKQTYNLQHNEIKRMINDYELYGILTNKLYEVCLILESYFFNTTYNSKRVYFHKRNIRMPLTQYNNFDELIDNILNDKFVNCDNNIPNFKEIFKRIDSKIQDYIISFDINKNCYIVNDKKIKMSTKFGSIKSIKYNNWHAPKLTYNIDV